MNLKTKIFKAEQQKRLKKLNNASDLLNNNKALTHLGPRRRGENVQRQKQLEESMAEKSPNLTKNQTYRIKKFSELQTGRNPGPDTITKLLKTKDRKYNLKAAKEKQCVKYEIIMIPRLHINHQKPRRPEAVKHFKSGKRKKTIKPVFSTK